MHQHISGGNHTHNYHFEQKELDLVSKDPVTIRMYPQEIDLIEKLAAAAGVSRSVYLRRIIVRWLKCEPKLKEVSRLLEDIFT